MLKRHWPVPALNNEASVSRFPSDVYLTVCAQTAHALLLI